MEKISIDPNIFLTQTREVIDKINFIPNQSVPLELKTEGYYTELLLKISLEVSANSSPSADPFWFTNIIKGISLQGSDSAPFLGLPKNIGGLELYYLNLMTSKGSFDIPSLPQPSHTQPVKYQLPIHFGDNYLNKYDPSEAIASNRVHNLTFSLDWGNQTDLGDGYSIDPEKSKAKLDISYILLQPRVTEQRAFAPRGWYPGQLNARGRRIFPSFWQPGTKQTKLEISKLRMSGTIEQEFISGFYLKDVLIFVLDIAGSLRNDLIRKVLIKNKRGKLIFEREWEALVDDCMRQYNLVTPSIGVACIDLRELFLSPSGIKLSKNDDLLWEFTALGECPIQVIILYRIHKSVEASRLVRGKIPAETAIF